MTTIDESPDERYFYRSSAASSRHRHRVSVYLVEYRRGSTVVARIEPMGLMHESFGEHDLVLQGLRRNLVLTGRWQTTPSQHHARVRLTSPARA